MNSMSYYTYLQPEHIKNCHRCHMQHLDADTAAELDRSQALAGVEPACRSFYTQRYREILAREPGLTAIQHYVLAKQNALWLLLCYDYQADVEIALVSTSDAHYATNMADKLHSREVQIIQSWNLQSDVEGEFLRHFLHLASEISLMDLTLRC